MKKRVLHVLSSNDFAGAENVAISIISNLSDSYEFRYASPFGGIHENLLERGVTYAPMKKLSFFELRKVIRNWNPDIIHAHDFTATLLCLVTGFNKPVISHIHQNPDWLQSINKYSILFFLACLKIKELIVVSPVIKETTFLSNFFNKKCKVIKNIVDINWIKKNSLNPTGNTYDIAFIGRFEEIKDPLRFINIISQLVLDFPTLRVLMMGGGNLEKKCSEVINEKKLSDIIELKGFLLNPYPYIRNSKILVMTSKSEGLPMIAMEALAIGRPVVVSNLKGIENIIDSSCGFICNSDSEFIENIGTLLRSEGEYMKMSAESTKKATKICNMDEYRKQLKMVYNSVI
ncbi:glycosyltransferase [Bacillus sp. Cr_A10]|uniref:glycosyltransferase n=1 Tax=Bacillus sp. Cr_A10 TaxID=3033993 RepID=UPI0023D988CB|nr:glycosyltransferase [Bacillus sp. Cr_A10]MDF2065064.1 glycosyltransferase [Bacillus sp. Cr_A10]